MGRGPWLAAAGLALGVAALVCLLPGLTPAARQWQPMAGDAPSLAAFGPPSHLDVPVSRAVRRGRAAAGEAARRSSLWEPAGGHGDGPRPSDPRWARVALPLLATLAGAAAAFAAYLHKVRQPLPGGALALFSVTSHGRPLGSPSDKFLQLAPKVRQQILDASKFNYLRNKRSRTVIIDGCPPTLRADEMQQRIPWASVQMLHRNAALGNRAFVTLSSPDEAEDFLEAVKNLKFRGRPVHAYLADVDSDEYKSAMDARTVVLSGCPPSVAAMDVLRQFPGAVEALLLPKYQGGPPSGKCHLAFRSPEEVQAILALPEVRVKGHLVKATPKGGNETFQTEVLPRTVVLTRCPVSASAADVDAQFPNAEEIMMMPPGRPFCGKCFVVFPTVAEAQAVVASSRVELLGRPIIARMREQDTAAHKRDVTCRTVVLTRCPATVTPAELQAQFPMVEEIRLVPQKMLLAAAVFLIFATLEEARAVAESEVIVQGRPVIARMSASTPENYKKDKKDRSIYLPNCPAGTTLQKLFAAFPAAEEVHAVTHRVTGAVIPGAFFVMFGSPEQAQAVAEVGVVELEGVMVPVKKPGSKGSGNYSDEVNDDKDADEWETDGDGAEDVFAVDGGETEATWFSAVD